MPDPAQAALKHMQFIYCTPIDDFPLAKEAYQGLHLLLLHSCLF
jgi:hypothetical protein